MGAVASDGREGFKKRLPRFHTVLSLWARNRDITLRNAESKEKAKLKAECFEHLNTYAMALRKVAAANLGIFDDSDCYWNLDETKVHGEFRRKLQVLGASNTHNGGLRSPSTSAGSGKYTQRRLMLLRRLVERFPPSLCLLARMSCRLGSSP